MKNIIKNKKNLFLSKTLRGIRKKMLGTNLLIYMQKTYNIEAKAR